MIYNRETPQEKTFKRKNQINPTVIVIVRRIHLSMRPKTMAASGGMEHEEQKHPVAIHGALNHISSDFSKHRLLKKETHDASVFAVEAEVAATKRPPSGSSISPPGSSLVVLGFGWLGCASVRGFGFISEFLDCAFSFRLGTLFSSNSRHAYFTPRGANEAPSNNKYKSNVVIRVLCEVPLPYGCYEIPDFRDSESTSSDNRQ